MHQPSGLFVSSSHNEAPMKRHIQAYYHEIQTKSPTSAESSPPIVARLKPRSQKPSPSSVGFSMHRIALALAASASAKHYMLQTKRLTFDRFFVSAIFGQGVFRSLYPSLLRQKYLKALQTNHELQQRLLNAHEVFSVRVGIIISVALKTVFFNKWRRFWLLRSSNFSKYKHMHAFFNNWSKALSIKIATQVIAGQKQIVSKGACKPSSFHNEDNVSLDENSLSFKFSFRFVLVFDDCFCRWKELSRNRSLKRSKMHGLALCMQHLAKVFAFRGCNIKVRFSRDPAFPETDTSATCRNKKTLLLSTCHLRSAVFIMWAALSPSRQVSVVQHVIKPLLPSKEVMDNFEPSSITNLASPIIMSGTPPASPPFPPVIRSPFQISDGAKLRRMLLSQNQANILEGDVCFDSDSYAAAVLMDHHQSLCNQSATQLQQSRDFRRKPIQIHHPQNLEDSLLNSISDVSDDSEGILETSSNQNSDSVFATTLRPLSPTTKAHIRNNIIVPTWGIDSSAGVQKSNQSSASVQQTQKMQAFKIVRSPPLISMQETLAGRKSNVAHTEKIARRDVAHIGWGCFTGVSTDFPAAGSQKHGSFLSSAIALRMRMSEELQSKELTSQKMTAVQLRSSGSFDTARQRWVRR
jgi:hypothetical protein